MPNYDQLLDTLAKQLNIPKDSLQTAVQSGNPNAVAALLSGKQAQAFRQILSDPQTVQKILNSKEAQTLQNHVKP